MKIFLLYACTFIGMIQAMQETNIQTPAQEVANKISKIQEEHDRELNNMLFLKKPMN